MLSFNYLYETLTPPANNNQNQGPSNSVSASNNASIAANTNMNVKNTAIEATKNPSNSPNNTIDASDRAIGNLVADAHNL